MFTTKNSLPILILISFLAGGLIGSAATDFRLVSGLVSANEDELANCTFALAQDTAIMYRPGSIPCLRMKELVGRKVDMWFTVVD
jgi:hypothetical protein